MNGSVNETMNECREEGRALVPYSRALVLYSLTELFDYRVLLFILVVHNGVHETLWAAGSTD